MHGQSLEKRRLSLAKLWKGYAGALFCDTWRWHSKARRGDEELRRGHEQRRRGGEKAKRSKELRWHGKAWQGIDVICDGKAWTGTGKEMQRH